jgi:hypothetical protein
VSIAKKGKLYHTVFKYWKHTQSSVSKNLFQIHVYRGLRNIQLKYNIPKTPYTITKMDDNINMDSTIAIVDSCLFILFPGWCHSYYDMFYKRWCRTKNIQLLRVKGWVPINWFNPTIFLCLSQATIWIV